MDQAVRRIMQLRDRGFRWVVDADIERYFDEIPIDKLLERLARHWTRKRSSRSYAAGSRPRYGKGPEDTA